MQRFGRLSALASALLLIAATAHADPFTLDPGRKAAAAGGTSWFNNLVKLDDAFVGGGQLFLTNATISFGGQSITVPSATISFSSDTTSTSDSSSGHSSFATGHGFNSGFFFGGGGGFVNKPSGNSNSQGQDGASATGGTTWRNGSQVPGAGAALNPFSPELGSTTGTSTSTSTGSNGGTINLLLANGTTARISAAAITLSDPVSATPEPSPLLLLATGLGVFFVWKKRNALKSTMA